jgi:hypothetical protein
MGQWPLEPAAAFAGAVRAPGYGERGLEDYGVPVELLETRGVDTMLYEGERPA